MGLTSSTPSQTQEHPQSSADVIETALLLRQLSIPPDLIPQILDLAKYWAPVASDSRGDEITVTESGAGRTYLQLALPTWLPARRVCRLKFTMESKDQGWSSWPVHHGTYEDSWSWWEVSVVRRDRDVEDDTRSSSSGSSSSNGPGRRWIFDEAHSRNARNRIWRTRLQNNVHAGTDFAVHVVEWVNDKASKPRQPQNGIRRETSDVDDTDDVDREVQAPESDEAYDIQQMMWDLKGGDVIGLTVWARFPGWLNQIRGAKIEVDAAVVRRM